MPLRGSRWNEAVSVPQAVAQDATWSHQGQEEAEEGAWHHCAVEAIPILGQYEASMEAEGGL
jgi:hypothetical protein